MGYPQSPNVSATRCQHNQSCHRPLIPYRHSTQTLTLHRSNRDAIRIKEMEKHSLQHKTTETTIQERNESHMDTHLALLCL